MYLRNGQTLLTKELGGKPPSNYYEYIQFYHSNLNVNHELRLYDIKYKHRRPVSVGLWFHTINRNGSICRCRFRTVMEGRIMDTHTDLGEARYIHNGYLTFTNVTHFKYHNEVT